MNVFHYGVLHLYTEHLGCIHTSLVQIPAPFSVRREKAAVQHFLSIVAADQLSRERRRCSEEGERMPVHNGTHLRIRCVPIEEYVPAIHTALPRKCTLFWAMRSANATHICEPD